MKMILIYTLNLKKQKKFVKSGTLGKIHRVQAYAYE